MDVDRTPVDIVFWLGEQTPEAVALTDVNGRTWDYRSLAESIGSLAAALSASGIRRTDRVVVVLADRTQAALGFLAVSTVAVAAPLNPELGQNDYEFYLRDLDARLVVTTGSGSDALRSAARATNVPVVYLVADNGDQHATLVGEDGAPLDRAAKWVLDGRAEDVALVLHTSGTTARPKLVPLTHGNLTHSALNVARALSLSAADRCLCVMPLFHIHGLVASLLASLLSGGTVICVPAFDPERFASWLNISKATWYSAVPTVHQAVLELAGKEKAATQLRFIRSSSSPLPPTVMVGLEEAFGVPVVEAYGMTEAAHQIASNPLPPRRRKAGSVGLPAGAEVVILDASGAAVPEGLPGEICIRGNGVTAGYYAAPDANHAAFTDDWLRTGDEGYLDNDGYVHITGRIKELINRGGEKIAPREIEEELLQHPAVAQAAAFAVPHESLGEEVGIAVVLRAGEQVADAELREFVRRRLAYFKVPRHVVILSELPKGPTGKVQRTSLAARLGITAEGADRGTECSRQPESGIESDLAAIVAEVLGVRQVDATADFLVLGGDSLQATRVLARVRRQFGVELTLPEIFELATIERMAIAVTTRQAAWFSEAEVGRLLDEVVAADGADAHDTGMKGTAASDQPPG